MKHVPQEKQARDKDKAARLHFSRTRFREIAPFGAGVAANRLLGFASENLDSVIVGRLFGIAALGFLRQSVQHDDESVGQARR